MRARLLLVVALLLASCSECALERQAPKVPRTVEKIRWPVSAPTDLQMELAATAVEWGEREVTSDEPPPESLPGVQVREHVLHGLYLLEVVLGDVDFDDPLPLVVLLHGRGDLARVPGGPFGGVPTPMRLILPQGPQPLGQGYTWLPVSITEKRPDDLAQSLRERAAQLAELVRFLQETWPTLGRPVVAGFSQGGMLALTLALHHGALFSAAFPLASWVPPTLWPAGGPPPELELPIRSLHGADDPIIPLGPTRELFERLSTQGWDARLVEFEGVAHVMSPDMNLAFEQWLEEALARLAPELEGGLGELGPEVEGYEPYEALDDHTLRAIEAAQDVADQVATDGDTADGEPRGVPLDPDGAAQGQERDADAPAAP